MWRLIFGLARQLFNVVEESEWNRVEIKELRQEVSQLTGLVQNLAFELRRRFEHESHEREELTLQLENTLMQFERRLLLGKPREGRKQADNFPKRPRGRRAWSTPSPTATPTAR